jgi:GT2 family glycosyltransferase
MLDVVILSNAKTLELSRITANCIDSLLASNSEMNIFVVEQNQGINWAEGHSNIRNVYLDMPFNYNQFANIAVKHGRSEWICIANNDLIFEPNWFREILKANYPICSPICPDDKRQQKVIENEIGEQVGRHLSGWCFVIKRSLWEAIGGFDEDFEFWCADNSLMEQLLSIGIKPMLVKNSIVKHLGSKTLVTMENREELTRDQVKKFNKKYNKNLFGWGT